MASEKTLELRKIRPHSRLLVGLELIYAKYGVIRVPVLNTAYTKQRYRLESHGEWREDLALRRINKGWSKCARRKAQARLRKDAAR